MVRELKITDAQQHPANFLYIFASDEFLALLDEKPRKAIVGKAANQRKLLLLSAQKYKKTYKEYYDAIYQGFQEIYGITPAAALVKLANGETVAGKNWKEGVYGIGAISSNTIFNGLKFNGQAVTVDANTGHIMCGGKDITDTSKTVYDKNIVTGEAVASLYSATNSAGNIIVQSRRNPLTGKYYADTYSVEDDEQGGVFSASTNKPVSASSTSNMWGEVILNIGQFIQWLLSIFGINTSNMLTAENTLPNQTADGFVVEAGVGEAGAILLALAAGGALLAGGSKKK